MRAAHTAHIPDTDSHPSPVQARKFALTRDETLSHRTADVHSVVHYRSPAFAGR